MTVNLVFIPNGADVRISICVVTVDFALTYFIVSGNSRVPGFHAILWLVDAAGQSVLTARLVGKLSADSIASFVKTVALKIKMPQVCDPGKVTSLKGELHAQPLEGRSCPPK